MLMLNISLVALDQEKAFDSVEHRFLWNIVERFGFSTSFIARIKVLYSNIESVLKVNDSLCAPFRAHKGVQQGCALSGLLYALSLEPLLHKLRSTVCGLFLPGFLKNVILSAYADHLVVFIRDQQDMTVLTDITRPFLLCRLQR